ncbi:MULTISPECIES: sialate O-acetylesterase [Enterococcus]|uniref:Sialate O-acetylesterase n=1 Tax=Enterococcus alishanensis TaxID=1303817 RepID=A0ABS6TD71_9ENTE|nr:sialate O-acetylesterase [Enterococcus alishanensis]MBV7390839.1 sialate O-acetylesterase [Enterococcus alishanensis]
MKSFLLVGQSNMAGRGFIHTVPPIYNEKIQMLRNGRFQMMAEPIHSDREVAGIGLAASFAQAYSFAHPDETIGLIPCAEGGSSIAEWSPEGVLFRHAVKEAKFAQETSEIIGILWHQGENDSLNQLYKSYEGKLREVFAAFREVLDLPDVPIIIGELPNFLGKTGFGQQAIEYHEINQILRKIAYTDEHFYFVTAKGLSANPDGIHLDALSQRKFGLRYYEAFANQQDQLIPLENEDQKVSLLYQKDRTATEAIYLASKKFALGQIDYPAFSQEIAPYLPK